MSATNRGSERNASDFYPTPSWCTKKLLEKLILNNVQSFYEPCKGDGAIYDIVPIANKDWSEIQLGRDYLIGEHKSVDLIITNPPYSLAIEFIEKALTHSKAVVMLLRLNYLESQKRFNFWQANPPSHLITLSKRPSFTGKGTDATGYAWVVWNGEGIVNAPTFSWIKQG